MVAVNVLVIPAPRGAAALSWPKHPAAPCVPSVSLAEALTSSWPTDAHFTAYDAPTPPRRLSNDGPTGAVWELGPPPRMALLVVDVDHEPTHAENKRRKAAKQALRPAPEAWRTVERARVDALRAIHPGVVSYETLGGYRLVALLASPHTVDGPDAKASWARWYLSQLGYLSRAFGIVGDPACADWTRLYRLPRATRNGSTPEAWPFAGDAHAVGVWDRAEDAGDAAELVRLAAHDPRWDAPAKRVSPPAPRPRAPRAARSRPVDAKVVQFIPPGPLAARLATGIGALPRGIKMRHNARLAVVAVLRRAGWSHASLERLVHELAAAMGKDAARLVSQLVPTTVALVDRDGAVLGEGYLRREAPAVWEAVHEQLEGAAHADRIARGLAARGVPQLVSRADAAELLAAAYRDARGGDAGLVLVACTAGAGKTHAAVADAAEAAAHGRRTAILAPSHAVAREVLAALRGRGVVAHHLVGIASHEDAGARTCHHHEAAAVLAAAAVPVVPALCDGRGLGDANTRAQRTLPVVRPTAPNAPCVHRATCPAYASATAPIPPEALVVVGVHQHAEKAHGWLTGHAGALLVVDEAPLLLDAARWSGDELRRAADRAPRAMAPWERWRAELLAAAAHGLRADTTATAIGPMLVAGLVAQGMAETEAHERVRGWCAKAAEHPAPAPSRVVLRRARGPRGAELVKADADVLRAAGMIARALVAEADAVTVSVAVRDYGADAGAHELRVCGVVAPMAAALRDPSIGRVVLDATGDAELLTPFVGAVDARTLTVADPCTARRVFIPWSHGTRRHTLTPEGQVRWDAAAAPMAEALALALVDVPDGGSIALLGYKAVVDALRRAWESPDTADAAAVALLGPLRDRGITPRWGHYGALRGRNTWSGVDAAAILGTPYPPVADAQQRAEAHGMPGAGADFLRLAAADELEQAVARGVRGLRDKPVTLVVLAAELPRRADARWTVRALVTGRPAKAAAAELVTLAARLGIAGAAAAAGVSTRTVQRAKGAVGGSPLGGVTKPASHIHTSRPSGLVTPAGGVVRRRPSGLSLLVTGSVTPPRGGLRWPTVAFRVPARGVDGPVSLASRAGGPARALPAAACC